MFWWIFGAASSIGAGDLWDDSLRVEESVIVLIPKKRSWDVCKADDFH